MKTLTFLHTAEVHVTRFDNLLADFAPDYRDWLTVQHIVNETLLPPDGKLTEDQRRQALSTMMQLSGSADLTVCTCSTLGPIAELVNEMVDGKVMRIDAPMAREALGYGPAIVVAACLTSTIAPTQKLILEAAEGQDVLPMLTPLLIDGAWTHFQDGDDAAYGAAIADSVTTMIAKAKPDCVLLAQASMDCALPALADCGVPIICSPQSGMREALAILS